MNPFKLAKLINSLQNANEVHTMGNRPLQQRSVEKFWDNKKNRMRAKIAAGVVVASIPLGMMADGHTGFLNTDAKPTQATVLRKIHQTGVKALGEGETKVWSNMVDAPNSAYQLVLGVDNQEVVVSVSRDLFNKYCTGNHLKFEYKNYEGEKYNDPKVADCDHAKNTKVDVAYTEGRISGNAVIVEMKNAEPNAEAFITRALARREAGKSFDEMVQINKKQRTSPKQG